MFKPWVPFEWIVAIRFLREGRMQTVFILVGVAVCKVRVNSWGGKS